MMQKLRDKLDKSIDAYNLAAVYKVSMSIGADRLRDEAGVRKSISDWKMQADLDMYREKQLYHKGR